MEWSTYSQIHSTFSFTEAVYKMLEGVCVCNPNDIYSRSLQIVPHKKKWWKRSRPLLSEFVTDIGKNSKNELHNSKLRIPETFR